MTTSHEQLIANAKAHAESANQIQDQIDAMRKHLDFLEDVKQEIKERMYIAINVACDGGALCDWRYSNEHPEKVWIRVTELPKTGTCAHCNREITEILGGGWIHTKTDMRSCTKTVIAARREGPTKAEPKS